MPNLFDIIAITSCILFLACNVPDLIQHIKEHELKGVSIYSSIMMILALILAAITNYHHKNFIFMVNDMIGVAITCFILVLRIKKT